MGFLVDAHAHLCDKAFDSDLDAAIDRARNAGLSAIISCGLDPNTNRKTLEITSKHDIIRPALGLYPTDALKLSESELDSELEFIEKSAGDIIAIGEVGLDYYWVKDKNDEQKKIFSRVIELAEKTKKPIIVHSRKAETDIIEMLASSTLKKIMLHCFGGPQTALKEALKRGWTFSIPTTAGRDQHFQRMIDEANISQLLTETDSPYLSLVKGERNEPAKIRSVVETIAKIKRLDVEETEKMLYMNFQKLFLI